MSDSLNERLNRILPRIISDDFLSGRGIGNEIAFYIFDYTRTRYADTSTCRFSVGPHS